MLQSLLPTDIGWYPSAQYHYREREQGADEHILIFCVAGTGWYEIAGAHYPLHTNEALLIPRGTPHVYGSDGPEPWTIHWVHFIGTEADFFLYHLPADEYAMQVDQESAAALERLFLQCYQSFVGGFILHRLIYCAQILHHLLGLLFFDNRNFSPLQQTSRFRSLEVTLTFLQQNVHRSIPLREMAERAGLSISHFSCLFKQQTGYSPMSYFINLKMQRACTLLTVEEKAVHEIAQEVGYTDPYYFSRLFKKIIGRSPTLYREQPIPHHRVLTAGRAMES